jgi:hypothetical protein
VVELRTRIVFGGTLLLVQPVHDDASTFGGADSCGTTMALATNTVPRATLMIAAT